MNRTWANVMVATAVLAVSAVTASATMLTFEYTHASPPPYFAAVPQTYGDNANNGSDPSYSIGAEGGTPNVEVAYLADDAEGGILSCNDATWFPSYVANLSGSTGNWDFEFTPDAGYSVQIHSFDVVECDLGGYPIDLSWQIVDSSGTVLNGGAAQGTVTSETAAIDVNMGGYHTAGQTVTLRITSVESLYNGIDNIKFSQIPEPATMVMVAIGGLGLALGKRRR